MNTITCEKCGHHLSKTGFGWSGKNRIQRYRCNGCGATYQRNAYQQLAQGGQKTKDTSA
jgi:transposase-like protein